jgi:predicted ATP-grasp superfamily ATP-dependent carboligase
VVRSTIDKPQTYQLAEALGVPVPRTILAKDFSQVEEYCRTADFPCLVKPRRSHMYFERFRRKLVKVHSPAALVAAYQEAVAAGLEVMLQEYIEGPDTAGVNYNSYAWEGQPLVEFTAQKIRMSPPDSGVPSVVLSKQIPDVIPAGRRLLQALSYQGYSCIEFKQDARDGRYKLLEINARHNRSSLLAVRCGINFPWLEYSHRVCGELPAVGGFREGLYWVDAARDMAAIGPYFHQGGFSLSGQLRPYWTPGVFAVWSLADPRPFVRRSAYLAARAVAAAMHGPGSLLQGDFWLWKSLHRRHVA